MDLMMSRETMTFFASYFARRTSHCLSPMGNGPTCSDDSRRAKSHGRSTASNSMVMLTRNGSGGIFLAQSETHVLKRMAAKQTTGAEHWCGALRHKAGPRTALCCGVNANTEFGEDAMNLLQIRGEMKMTDDGQEFGESFW